MKIVFFLISLTWATIGSSATVDADHLLFPVDQEFIYISGLEGGPSVRGMTKLIARCLEGTATPKDLPLCEAHDMIASSQIPLTDIAWETLNSKVIFFGERHTDQNIKFFVRDQLASLKSQGITILALEMFNSTSQIYLDAFLSGQLSLSELQKILETQWHYESAGYVALIVEAQRLGLKIIALDDRESVKGLDFFRQLNLRDAHMAAHLSETLLKNPEARAVALTGRLHAYRAFSEKKAVLSLPDILRTVYRISTQSIVAFSKNDDSPFNVLQTALHGSDSAALTQLSPNYIYSDYVLFLR